ncbi:hypothetical protein [Gimesia sp.]|uniref:hypothetical protein n=1 Tax=Gimesia sp. TaxID=2024833 RepID=UPI003A910DEA
MLNLPQGYPLDEFLKCSFFAYEMLMGQETAQEKDPGFIPRQNNTGNPVSDETDRFYLIETEGYDIAYFHELIQNEMRFGMCSYHYQEVIADCDGSSANIAELEFVCADYEGPDRHIAPTAHGVAFLYLADICSHITVTCGDPDSEESLLDYVKKNIIEMQKVLSKFQLSAHNRLRLMSRLKREMAITLGCHDYENHVNSDFIIDARWLCATVGKHRGRNEYERSWATKYISDWPKPRKRYTGNRKSVWSFLEVKPHLKEQFPDIDWDNF